MQLHKLRVFNIITISCLILFLVNSGTTTSVVTQYENNPIDIQGFGNNTFGMEYPVQDFLVTNSTINGNPIQLAGFYTNNSHYFSLDRNSSQILIFDQSLEIVGGIGGSHLTNANKMIMFPFEDTHHIVVYDNFDNSYQVFDDLGTYITEFFGPVGSVMTVDDKYLYVHPNTDFDTMFFHLGNYSSAGSFIHSTNHTPFFYGGAAISNDNFYLMEMYLGDYDPEIYSSMNMHIVQYSHPANGAEELVEIGLVEERTDETNNVRGPSSMTIVGDVMFIAENSMNGFTLDDRISIFNLAANTSSYLTSIELNDINVNTLTNNGTHLFLFNVNNTSSYQPRLKIIQITDIPNLTSPTDRFSEKGIPGNHIQWTATGYGLDSWFVEINATQDGSYVEYATGDFSATSTINVDFNSLDPGSYRFRFTAINNFSLSVSDEVNLGLIAPTISSTTQTSSETSSESSSSTQPSTTLFSTTTHTTTTTSDVPTTSDGSTDIPEQSDTPISWIWFGLSLICVQLIRIKKL